MRKSLICIVASGAIHFIEPTLLQGENYNLWFLLSTKGNTLPFEEVENLLLINKVAHNIVSVEVVRECGNAVDYKIHYNEYDQKESAVLMEKLLKSRH